MRGDRGLNKECIQGVLRYMGVKENIGYLNRQTKYKGHCTRRVMSQGGGVGSASSYPFWIHHSRLEGRFDEMLYGRR